VSVNKCNGSQSLVREDVYNAEDCGLSGFVARRHVAVFLLVYLSVHRPFHAGIAFK